MITADYHVRVADWSSERAALRKVRTRVFVQEQRVPENLEWDDADRHARHFVAEDNRGKIIATARLLPDGQVGRMAVERAWRGRGVGKALLQLILETADATTAHPLFLNAQVQAADFYARAGFQPEGEAFLEAGILHQRMVLSRI